MKIRPMSDNVFLEDVVQNRVSPGGIIIPDSVTSEYGDEVRLCKVTAAGPGGYGYLGAFDETYELRKERGLPTPKRKRKFFPVDVKEGDMVLVGKLAGELCVIGDDVDPQHATDLEAGQEIRIVRESEILCVIEPDARAE